MTVGEGGVVAVVLVVVDVDGVHWNEHVHQDDVVMADIVVVHNQMTYWSMLMY